MSCKLRLNHPPQRLCLPVTVVPLPRYQNRIQTLTQEYIQIGVVCVVSNNFHVWQISQEA